jgi:hypothetical protein
VDEAGNVEAVTGQAEAQTRRDIEAPFVTPAIWLPLILR